MQKKFDVPILFIIFRRKDTALQVIDAIAKVKPEKLYISQDGPRNKKEKKDVLETREAVLSRINWDCKLTFWEHKKNLGLKKHIPEAFGRFFEKEEYGIYLEDDTLPCEDFFYFQRELLKRYKNDKRIFSINGTNFYPRKDDDSLFGLTQIANVWGMGIWKRSWKLYDPDPVKPYISYRDYKDFVFSRKYLVYLEFFLNLIRLRKLNTWDYQLAYASLKNRMYSIRPSVNLVTNLGINKGTNYFLQDYTFAFGGTINMSGLKKNIDLPSYSKFEDQVYFNSFYGNFYIRILLNIIYYSLPYNFIRVLRSFSRNNSVVI